MAHWSKVLAITACMGLACGPSTDPELGAAAGDDQGTGVDADGDGYKESADCNDNDASIYPGAQEVEDGIDNDCDGKIDDNLPGTDDDGDGYSDDEGDCNDLDPLIGPSAVEIETALDEDGAVIAEGVDNDCDGIVDEALEPCDSGLSATAATDFAKAIELCSWVDSAAFNSGSDSRGRNIVGGFGNVYAPHAGSSMAVLATGVAVDASGPGFVTPNNGTAFLNTAPHPDPQPDPADGCGKADASTVNDITEMTLEVVVPSNAQAMSFDFAFMSGEFPEWVCSDYDDTFMVILESQQFNGNISFDDAGRPVTINVGFFDVCPVSQGGACAGDSELAGTGYEGTVGGGTGWLTTTAPVTPGEVITLRFLIFDEGDTIYDSLALIDNFRWHGSAVEGPITVERDPATALPPLHSPSWKSLTR